MRKQAHKIVAKTAKEFAGQFYEIAASQSNEFRKAYPSLKAFQTMQWHLFIEAARAGLELMLQSPDVPEGNKVQIRDALVKDQILDGKDPFGRPLGEMFQSSAVH